MLKSLFKGIFLVIATGASLTLLYFIYYLNFAPRTVCENPVQYSIGEVDPNFELSEAELLNVAKSAEHIWEHAIGINVLDYNPESEFKINLVFDERQQQTIEARNMESKLESLKAEQDDLSGEYDEIYGSYKEKLSEYNNLIGEFEKRVEKYNKEVEKWNEKGGAPKDIFEDLKKEEKELESLAIKIEKTRGKLNVLARENNLLVQEENEIVANYNSELMTYKDKFGGERKFDQGDYDGTRINVYQFNEVLDLRIILAHEFGHAFGIGHLDNPKAIMHYLMGEQNLDSGFVTDDDVNALKKVCEIERFSY